MKRAYVLMAVPLVLALSACSDGAEDRAADCAKISAALSRTADPSAGQVLAALRKVRPELKDDELAGQVDTVIESGGKDVESGGRDAMSDEEQIRFAEAAAKIRETCELNG